MNGEDDGPPRRSPGKPFGPRNRGKPGRRKGSRNKATIVQAIASERHTLKENGQKQTFTTAELLVKALNAKAMEGDVRAHVHLERLYARFTPQTDNAGYLVVPEPMTAEHWARHAEACNQVTDRRRSEDDDPDQSTG